MNTFALLENRKTNLTEKNSHYFSNPIAEIICYHGSDLLNSLSTLEKLRQKGQFLVGFVSYEAGYYFEPKLNTDILCSLARKQNYEVCELPLLHFIAFTNHELINQEETETLLQQLEVTMAENKQQVIYNLKTSFSKEDYIEKIAAIKKYLRDGESYQINFTGKYHFDFQGNPITLYRLLREQQRVCYSAFLSFNLAFQLLSLSPELFFKKEKQIITVQPMKGTAARSMDPVLDARNKAHLQNDEKNRTENLIIVDLLRNDLGKIAETGSVKVEELFKVESYETLHQMVSTITAKIPPQLNFADILTALFPCGSVTGAPKVRTMEIIHDLETEARGIYTGALGYILPDNDMCFNVAIRTIILQKNHGELGVGGGIIYDSKPQEEWNELQLKGKFLTELNAQFELIESFYYSPAEGYRYLENHLRRLQNSAVTFNFICSLAAIKAALDDYKKNLPEGPYKIKLLLYKKGEFDIQHESLIQQDIAMPSSIVIAEERSKSDNILLSHKTTSPTVRGFYNELFKKYCTPHHYFDVVFLNEKAQITEGTRSNIFISMDNKIYTPPVSCGLLPGVMREHFIHHSAAIEKPLTLLDLQQATKIWLTNSVRGALEVKIDY